MSRVTSRGSIATQSAGYITPRGDTVYQMNGSLSYTTETLSRSDITRTQKDSSGWRKPTPYSCTLTSADAGSVDIEVISGRYRYFNKGMIAPHTGLPSIQLDARYLASKLPASQRVDQAVILARNNVADRVASFGESLAELMRTLEGLGSLAASLDVFLDAAVKRDTTAMAKAIGVKPASRKHRRAVARWKGLGPTVANAWLCWNFGLSPIVSDMVSLAILLGEGKNLRVSGQSAVFEKGDDPRVVESLHAMSLSPASFKTYHSAERRRGTYVRLDYEVSFQMLRKLTSYGLVDMPATAWALVPYSFMVDFLLPVSEVLRSLTATFGLSFKGGSATRFVKEEWKYLYSTFVESPAYVWTRKNVSRSDLHGVHMVRTVFTTDPNPVTLWIKDPLSVFSVSATFAVLTQKFRRFF